MMEEMASTTTMELANTRDAVGQKVTSMEEDMANLGNRIDRQREEMEQAQVR